MRIVGILAKVGSAVLVLFIFSLVVGLIIIRGIDPDQYKRIISKEFNKITGQQLHITGPISFEVFPLPSAVLKDVVLDIKTKAKKHYHISAKEIDLEISLMALFKNKLEVSSFNVDKLSIVTSDSKNKDSQYLISSFSGSFWQTDFGFNLEDFEIKFGHSDLTGTLNVEPDDAITYVSGNIYSDRLDFNELTNKNQSNKPSTKIFSTDHLPLEFISNINSDIEFKIEEFGTKPYLLENLHGKLVIRDGKLTAKSTKGKFQDGHFVADLKIIKKKVKDKPKINLDLHASKVNLSKFLHKAHLVKHFNGGITNVELNVNGKGSSIKSIVSNLNGEVWFSMGKATVLNHTFSDSVSGTLFSFVNFLNPVMQKQKNTDIQCAAMHFKLKNGRAYAHHGVAIETNQFDVLGNGEIDFESEVIDFEINTQPKKNFSLEIGSFDKFFRVGGTLSKPKLIANPKGILEEGASIIAAVASGGLSIVAEKLISEVEKDRAPCANVLGDKHI